MLVDRLDRISLIMDRNKPTHLQTHSKTSISTTEPPSSISTLIRKSLLALISAAHGAEEVKTNGASILSPEQPTERTPTPGAVVSNLIR